MKSEEIKHNKLELDKAQELMNQAESIIREIKAHKNTILKEELKDEIERFTVTTKQWYIEQISELTLKGFEIDNKYYTIINNLNL